jgi:hypothetical protein
MATNHRNRPHRPDPPDEDPGRRGPSPLFSPPPALIDSLIIAFVSAAITLFMFFLATAVLGQRVLDSLPDYLAAAFSSVWTAVVSGGVGIGLAVYRALTQRTTPPPHYLLWILVTTLTFTGVVVLLSLLYRGEPVKRIKLPDDIKLLPSTYSSTRTNGLLTTAFAAGPTSPDARQPFFIHNATDQEVGFRMEGEYVMSGGRIEGRLTKVSAWRWANSDRQPVMLTHMAVFLCYVQESGGEEKIRIAPSQPGVSNSTSLAQVVAVTTGSVELPAFNFRIELPRELQSRKKWLCGHLLGGPKRLYAGYQTDRFVNNSPVPVVPEVPVVWKDQTPLKGTPKVANCPCARTSIYTNAPNPDDSTFIELKNDCQSELQIIAVKAPGQVEPTKLFTNAPSRTFAVANIPRGHRVRFHNTGIVHAIPFIQKCD